MMHRLANGIGSSDGQAWTLTIGASVAALTVVIGLPPVLHTGAEVPAATSAPVLERSETMTSGDPAERRRTAQESRRTAAKPAVSKTSVSEGRGDRTAPSSDPAPSPLLPEPSPSATDSPDGPFVQTTSLAIAGSGWARADVVGPHNDAPVPPDGLPIAATLSRHDYRSYLRLTGGTSELRLEILEDSAPFPQFSTVVACPVTDPHWEEGGDQRFGEAPAFNCGQHAVAARDDGFMVFDLADLDPDRPAGFALVPAPGSPTTFRVTLAASGKSSGSTAETGATS